MMMALRVALAVSALYMPMASSAPRLHPTLVADMSHAKSSQSIAQQLWSKNLDACLTRDDSTLAEIQRLANQQLHSRNNISGSFFPSCHVLLLDVLYFNGGCYTGKFSQKELDRARANWTRDNADCARQLESTSDKTEALSDTDWEAERRKDGASESEIQLMKEIRSL
jgi:hypothetical protein